MSDKDLNDFTRGLRIIMDEQGRKPAPLSTAAGLGISAVRDLFRKGGSPTFRTVSSLAAALGMSVEQIAARGRNEQPLSAPHGSELFDQATPYTPRPVLPGTALDAHLAPETPHRCTFKAGRAAPWLGVLAGDLLVVDMRNPARAGDTVVANVLTGNRAETRILRYLPPHLASGDPTEAPIPEAAARIQGPVVALARGPGL